MQILGDRQWTEVPGAKTFELPPLILRTRPQGDPLHGIVDEASRMVDEEELVPLPDLDAPAARLAETRRFDMALNLVEQYRNLLSEWDLGDSVLAWIRQCEITFETIRELRTLLRPDVWPHAGRTSFVQLLEDKRLMQDSGQLEKAVGMRLTFRQPPPINFFSEQFLFYLNGSVAQTAFSKWAEMTPAPVASLPPERFELKVIHMDLSSYRA